MIYSALNYRSTSGGDQVYICLHAEQILNSYDNKIDLIYSQCDSIILTTSTLIRIAIEIQQMLNVVLILDFNNFKSCQSNADEYLDKIKEKVKLLVLINVEAELIEGLKINDFLTNPKNLKFEDKYPVLFLDKKEFSIVDKYQEVYSKCFEENLIKYIDGNEFVYHPSSSVYLNKYINVKKLIVLENKLFLTGLYFLAFRMNQKWSKDKPCLVCLNLNSSYIASILSAILKWDVLILDKIGPINNLYTRLESNIISGKNYIVVSDVVCLGTEVKIAKNLIEYAGGKYLGNSSIIRVQAISELDRKYDNFEFIYEINKENNKKIDFKIEINLSL